MKNKTWMFLPVFAAAVLFLNFHSQTLTRRALAPGQANQPIVYPIVGESKNLTPSERTSMERARKRTVELAKANRGIMFINGPVTEKAVAITIDDGPDTIVTASMLDVLKEHNVKASFFFIGERISENPEIARRAHEEGHLVLPHSYSHTHFTTLSANALKREIALSEEKISNLIGKRPAVLRPPYGDLNQKTINEINKNNYKIAMWSIDTLDWSQREKDNIVKNVVDNIRPGDIILLHSNENTVPSLEALPVIIEQLRAKGYEFKRIDELLGIEAYR
jgi:peptidoglycan-N-acetylglucosamine deacetylase